MAYSSTAGRDACVELQTSASAPKVEFIGFTASFTVAIKFSKDIGFAKAPRGCAQACNLPGTASPRLTKYDSEFMLGCELFKHKSLSHLSGSNGVDCDLDGANHIVDFKTLQGLSHYDNTSTIPGATLEKRQKAVNKEYHDRTRKLDSELHGSQQDQRGLV